MISALNFQTLVRIITGFAVISCALVLVAFGIGSPIALLSKFGLISLIVSFLILPLTVPSWFRKVYRSIRAPQWFFPLLDGEWEGEVQSNWPLVRAMFEASSGSRPAFDPRTSTLTDEEWGQPIPIRTTIATCALKFSMTMKMSGSKRRSDLLALKLDKDEMGRPRLRYLYKQVDENLVIESTDSSQHLGAAELIYDAESDSLTGEYWTNRSSDKGLSTAGRIVLRRCSVLSERAPGQSS